MNTISVSKNRIQKEGGMVILPIKEYQELLERAVPVYPLGGKEERLNKSVVKRLEKQSRILDKGGGRRFSNLK